MVGAGCLASSPPPSTHPPPSVCIHSRRFSAVCDSRDRRDRPPCVTPLTNFNFINPVLLPVNMTPKPKKTRESTKTTYSMEEMQIEMNAKLSALIEKFEQLEASLVAVTREKEILKVTVAEQAEEIADLRNSLNEREQYARSWSMRVLNIPVPKDSETDTRLVMQAVYDLLLLPILEGARGKGDISSVPCCETLLETAHILPGKGDSPKPVIARFYSRYWRNLVFRNRKEFAPREPISNSMAPNNTRSGNSRTSRMSYPFFEDLTKATFSKLSAIKQQTDVSSAWTVNGSIRFKLKDNNTVYRVSKLQDTLENIIS